MKIVFFEYYLTLLQVDKYNILEREQIINHINSSLDNYLVNDQMTRNKVRVKGLEILSAASLLLTDIVVYTQFEDTYK